MMGQSRAGRILMGWAGVLVCWLSTGCVCAFQCDWREAQRTGVPMDNLAGLWEGTWESGSNGHTGTLKAIITSCGNGEYEARYYGTFMGCVPFAYTTTHSATHQDGVTHFSGQQNLMGFGSYRTTGWANGQTFEAHFQAAQDHGVFRMSRVATAANCSVCSWGDVALPPDAIAPEPMESPR